MKCLALAAVLVAALRTPAPAQVASDPDRTVSGSGIRVEGWRGRTDRSEQQITDVRFTDWTGGYRITSGPHAVVWNPTHRATGDYTVTARLSKTRESISTHEESYGIFIAGTDLDGSRQNYLYCVVFGTGTAMVRHRNGSETATLMGKTANPSISKGGPDEPSDEVAMWVRNERIGCSVNGAEVFSARTRDMIGPGKMAGTDGVFGLRVSHNLDIIVTGLTMTPGR